MITINPLTNTQPMPDFSEPLVMMRKCHRKIENILAGLERASLAIESESEETRLEAFSVLRLAVAHFNGPAVKHTEDEEVSLFPRLRKHNTPEVKEALAILAQLEEQHRTKETVQKQFKYIVLMLPDKRVSINDSMQIKRVVSHLCELYRPHIRVEDELIFPLAEKILSSNELREIGEEMKERRKALFQQKHALNLVIKNCQETV